MQLEQRVEEELASLCGSRTGGSFLVACSGGLDSTVLACIAARRPGARVALAYVDHGLRPDTADDIAHVRALAARLGAGIELLAVDLSVPRHGRSLQDLAREHRYTALEEARVRGGFDWILTAHHADDQAETLLLHFFSGAGVEGLRGVRARAGHIIRPMLSVRKSDLQAFAVREGLQWRHDTSNDSDAYRRNALRHHVLPAIAAHVQSDIVSVLTRTASVFASLEQYLAPLIDEAAGRCLRPLDDGVHVDTGQLGDEAAFLRAGVLRAAVARVRGNAGAFADVRRLEELVSGAAGAQAPLRGGCIAYREHDGVTILRGAQATEADAVEALLGEDIDLGRARFSSRLVERDAVRFTDDPSVEYIDAERSGTNWVLRPWRAGDVFRPLGSPGRKKVGDFLTDHAVPRRMRGAVMVLDHAGEIIWLCGIRLDDRFKISGTTRSIAALRFETQAQHE